MYFEAHCTDSIPGVYRVDPNPDPHSLLRPETRLVEHTARTQPYIFLQPSLKKSWIKKNTSIVEIDLIFDFLVARVSMVMKIFFLNN